MLLHYTNQGEKAEIQHFLQTTHKHNLLRIQAGLLQNKWNEFLPDAWIDSPENRERVFAAIRSHLLGV